MVYLFIQQIFVKHLYSQAALGTGNTVVNKMGEFMLLCTLTSEANSNKSEITI